MLGAMSLSLKAGIDGSSELIGPKPIKEDPPRQYLDVIDATHPSLQTHDIEIADAFLAQSFQAAQVF